MVDHQWVWPGSKMVRCARPRRNFIGLSKRHAADTHAFGEPKAIEEMAICLDHRRTEAPLPRRAAAPMLEVERPHEGPAQRLHHRTERVLVGRSHQQSHFGREEPVAHVPPRPATAAASGQRLTVEREVGPRRRTPSGRCGHGELSSVGGPGRPGVEGVPWVCYCTQCACRLGQGRQARPTRSRPRYCSPRLPACTPSGDLWCSR